MQWIDEMAGIVAHRHAGTIVTTACVDNLNFKAGAYLGNTVVLIGKMTYVGRTSMEVRIDTYVEDSDGMRKMINRAYEVMVALDENDNKVEVPGSDSLRQRLKRQNGRVRKNVMHSERKEGLKDSEKFSDRNVTGENRWQKELASYLIHTDC